MKEFYAFDITIEPEQCPALITDLISNIDSNKINKTVDQKPNFIETLSHIYQDKILKNPIFTVNIANRLKEDTTKMDTIYGKAKTMAYSGDMRSISKMYQEISDRDARGFGNLLLNINGKTFDPGDLEEQIIEARFAKFNEVITPQDITMDHIVEYLQYAFQVTISEAQENFLRTQWNQGSLLGAHSSFLTNQTHISSNILLKPNYHVFNFNKNGELTSTQFVSSYFNIDDESQTGVFTTAADVSNLISISSENVRDSWLPQFSAKSVSISYASDNLVIPIDNSICKAVKSYAKFNQKPLLNTYLKTKAYVRATINLITEKFSKIYYTEKTPKSSESRIYTDRDKSVSRDSTSSYFTVRNDSILRDSQDREDLTIYNSINTLPPSASNEVMAQKKAIKKINSTLIKRVFSSKIFKKNRTPSI